MFTQIRNLVVPLSLAILTTQTEIS